MQVAHLLLCRQVLTSAHDAPTRVAGQRSVQFVETIWEHTLTRDTNLLKMYIAVVFWMKTEQFIYLLVASWSELLTDDNDEDENRLSPDVNCRNVH